MTLRESLDPYRSLWHVIAIELRRRREFHNLSGSRLAAVLECDRSTVSRYESGLLRLTERHAGVLDRKWTTGGLFSELVHHAKIRIDEDSFTGLTEYEARASRMRMWEETWIPGLLQTPEYARAALTVGLVDDLEDAFEKRMARQAAVFDRPTPPQLWVLLNWTVLEQPVGNASIMRGQLARLLEASELPHVSIRVVEREAGEHVGLDGSFWLLTRGRQGHRTCGRPAWWPAHAGPCRGSGDLHQIRPDRRRSMPGRTLAGIDRASDGELQMTQWRKSSRSNSSGGACVEVARLTGAIGIRDSKAPAAGHLTLSPESFATLITRAKRDEWTP